MFYEYNRSKRNSLQRRNHFLLLLLLMILYLELYNFVLFMLLENQNKSQLFCFHLGP